MEPFGRSMSIPGRLIKPYGVFVFALFFFDGPLVYGVTCVRCIRATDDNPWSNDEAASAEVHVITDRWWEEVVRPKKWHLDKGRSAQRK